MAEIVLYHALFSTCPQKVRFALAAKGLVYDSRVIDMHKAEHLEDWYLVINPNGVALFRRGADHRDPRALIQQAVREKHSRAPGGAKAADE